MSLWPLKKRPQSADSGLNFKDLGTQLLSLLILLLSITLDVSISVINPTSCEMLEAITTAAWSETLNLLLVWAVALNFILICHRFAAFGKFSGGWKSLSLSENRFLWLRWHWYKLVLSLTLLVKDDYFLTSPIVRQISASSLLRLFRIFLVSWLSTAPIFPWPHFCRNRGTLVQRVGLFLLFHNYT